MKIVIDISDNLMDYIVKGRDLSEEQNDEMALAIANGTPLPEHHGRLIDGDKVLDDIVKKNPVFISETDKHKRYARLVYYWAVKNAPTIIKGSESEC